MYFAVVTTDDSGWVRLAVTGEVDLASVPDLRRELLGALTRSSRIVLDLSGVDLIDSVGLSLLLSAHRRTASVGGGLVVVCPPGRSADLLTATSLDRILDIRAAFTPADVSP